MTLLNRLRLGARLATAFATVIVLLLVVMATAILTAARQGAAASRMEQTQQFVELLKDAKFSSADFNGWQTAYAFDALRGVADAAQDTGASRAAFLTSIRTFQTTVATATTSATSTATRTELESIATLAAQFLTVDTQIAELYRRDTTAARTAANVLVIGQEIEIFQQIGTHLDTVAAAAGTDFAAARSSATAAQRTGDALIWSAGTVAALIAAGLALVVTRSVTRPVDSVRRRLVLLADGDLASPVIVTGRDEIAAMATALRQSLSALGTAMRTIDGSATSLAAAAASPTRRSAPRASPRTSPPSRWPPSTPPTASARHSRPPRSWPGCPATCTPSSPGSATSPERRAGPVPARCAPVAWMPA
ncbi:HAMP domain-containing protein [Actinoplanes palleronii]|uniref:HAMP domain-containing protein n=1 Tax=Actinoplanes palleronii TaxID=113570 RepID=UPI001941C2C0|nr:HAMP domain-containing protein [Actinoplanes palleronii]